MGTLPLAVKPSERITAESIAENDAPVSISPVAKTGDGTTEPAVFKASAWGPLTPIWN